LNPAVRSDDLVASVEASWLQNESDDFVFRFNQVDAGNITLQFTSPKEIRLSALEDDGWQTRLLVDGRLGRRSFWSGWVGLASYTATSSISTDITYAPIRSNFDRTFDIREDQLQAGIGVNWQIERDTPLQLFYEYRQIDRDEGSSVVGDNNSTLARYTNPGNLSPETSNHIVTGKIGYWPTPRLNLYVTGKVMSNQFLGIIPHYNNTLTSRFFDKLYGYAAFGVSYVF
jgi:hypothetical protein